MGTAVIHANGRTDGYPERQRYKLMYMTKLMGSSLDYANAPINSALCPQIILMDFVWHLKTNIIALHIIHRLPFLIEAHCVLCETRIEY